MYSKELLISTKENGYRDILASIDLSTYRRIPWENYVPFFLLSYNDPDTKEPISVDPRGTLKKTMEKADKMGYIPYAGVEYEVYSSCILSVGSHANSRGAVFQLQRSVS